MNRKRENARTDRKITAIWLVCMAVFILELFFYTWCRVQYTRVGYEISQADQSRRENYALQNSLKIELERLKSPERIAKIAEKYLGLATPAPEQMVTIQ